jgi:hypothetical protein
MAVRIDVGMEDAHRKADARDAEGVQRGEDDVQLERAALERCVCLFTMSEPAHFSSPYPPSSYSYSSDSPVQR